MDTHAADLPGNSIAAATRDLTRELFTPAAIAQARDELVAECARPGRVHAAYVDYCGSIGILSHRQYVLMLERINALTWQAKFESVLRDLTTDPEAA